MIPYRPQNLRISREAAILVAVSGAMMSVTAIIITVLLVGVDERTGPIVLSVVGGFGMAITALVAALKATESADTASKTYRATEQLVSDTATIKQTATVPEICPVRNCPMRGNGGAR